MRELIRAAGELLASLPREIVGVGVLFGILGTLAACWALGAGRFF